MTDVILCISSPNAPELAPKKAFHLRGGGEFNICGGLSIAVSVFLCVGGMVLLAVGIINNTMALVIAGGCVFAFGTGTFVCACGCCCFGMRFDSFEDIDDDGFHMGWLGCCGIGCSVTGFFVGADLLTVGIIHNIAGLYISGGIIIGFGLCALICGGVCVCYKRE